METTEIKRVTAKARKSTDGTLWNLIVKCPFCMEEHTHGAGAVVNSPDGPAKEYYGRRATHCHAVAIALVAPREYFVESASK